MIKILKYMVYSLPILLLIYVILIRSGLFENFDFLNALATDKNQPFELIGDMDHQKKALPQTENNLLKNSEFKTLTPDSSFPMSGTKYHYVQIDFAEAETAFKNPLPADEIVINRGKQRFETFCVPCHNNDGKGRGKIITDVKLKEDEEGFPEPANLTRPETVRMSDARLFHILSSGQNLMFPVNDKLSENERWALVHYIRYLQKKK